MNPQDPIHRQEKLTAAVDGIAGNNGTQGGHSFSRFRTLLCLYFLVCIGVFAVRSAHWQLVNDAAQLHYACFLMDHGMAPYRDLIEINMPGTYLVNWSVMHTLGEGSRAWRGFDFGLLGMAAWAMIAIAWPYDWLAGLLGATLFILYHGRDGPAQAGQRDLIIAVLLLCAYAFLFASFRSRKHWPMFAFGLCGGMAAIIKPTPLPFVILLLVLAVVRRRREGQPVLKFSLVALLGLLVPFAVAGAFLIAEHSLRAFWYLLRVDMPFYNTVGRLSFLKLVVYTASSSARTIALIAFAIALMKRERWNWEAQLVVTGIVFGIASFIWQGKGFPYHRYPFLAFLFLWAGLEIIPALRARGMVRALAMGGLAFVVILAPIYVYRSLRKVWDPRFTDSLTADLNQLGGHRLSGHVQCIYMPADCDTALYRMRLVQSTGLFYDYLIFGSAQQPAVRGARQQFWHQFENNTPRVIVVGAGLFPSPRGYAKLASWPLFQQELGAHYLLYKDCSFPDTEFGEKAYRIYVEKGAGVMAGGGALAPRSCP